MSAILEIKYFNTFWIKKMRSVVENTPTTPVAPFANVPADYGSSDARDWYIEESRIRGGYNNTSVDFGVKAYLVEDTFAQQHRISSIIYSLLFILIVFFNKSSLVSDLLNYLFIVLLIQQY